MGINMEKMRARMEALQGNGNNRKNNFWKPQEGEQTIRPSEIIGFTMT